jgi:hypothetical protein
MILALAFGPTREFQCYLNNDHVIQCFYKVCTEMLKPPNQHDYDNNNNNNNECILRKK